MAPHVLVFPVAVILYAITNSGNLQFNDKLIHANTLMLIINLFYSKPTFLQGKLTWRKSMYYWLWSELSCGIQDGNLMGCWLNFLWRGCGGSNPNTQIDLQQYREPLLPAMRLCWKLELIKQSEEQLKRRILPRGQMYLHVFLEPCWLTEPHKNKTECMEMRLSRQGCWQMVVVTYFACTKACKIEWDKIFQHSLLFLPVSFKKKICIFFLCLLTLSQYFV